MKYGMINAVILVSAVFVSAGIVVARISYANRNPKMKQESVAPSRPETKGKEVIPSVSPEESTLAEVKTLLTTAEKLFHSSGGVEGRELELQQAKKSLESVRDLLETLPGDAEEVKKLKIRHQQLYYDVIKASGFDG